jgi:hypothetical protein
MFGLLLIKSNVREKEPGGYSKKCVKVNLVNINNFDYGKEKA